MATPSKPGSEDSRVQAVLTAFDTLFNKRDYASILLATARHADSGEASAGNDAWHPVSEAIGIIR